ncbi:MAG: hypothetical protein IKD66_02370 [Solobacterium sp.]|nr:hypothetical protein [Solobacterium sp.]
MKPSIRILLILILAKPWISKLSRISLLKLVLVLFVANRMIDAQLT